MVSESPDTMPGISNGMPAMILGIDTAGRFSSVALVDETQVLASFYLQQTLTISAHLLHLIDTLCMQVGCDIHTIDGLAISLGPGGFTSLRVGLATAQGLAMALGKPLVGCSTFEALVASAAGWEGLVCPVLEARRREVYTACYRRQGATMQETLPGVVISPEDLCSLLTERTLLLGSGVRTYGALWTATLGTQVVCLEGMTEGALAVSVALVGQERLHEAHVGMGHRLTPLYIRAADARLPRHSVAGGEPVASYMSTVPQQ
jgi:tRNA threonylcarbamoyladenosine biosynthesis protein TsaB